MTVILKATDSADILSLFPTLLGYMPHDSVILMAFRGKRTCGSIRVPLPGLDQPEVFSRVAVNAIGLICKIPGADGVAFAVFTPERFGDSRSVPREDFADVLLDRIVDSGLALKDGLCRAADGWASYVDGGAPTGGWPLGLLDDTDRAGLPERHRDSDGRDLPDRVPSAGPGQRRQMLERLEAIDAAIDRITIVSDAHPGASDDVIEQIVGPDLDLVEATLDFPSFADRALEWTPEMLDEHGAMLLYGITRPAVRDDTMLMWAFGPDAPALAAPLLAAPFLVAPRSLTPRQTKGRTRKSRSQRRRQRKFDARRPLFIAEIGDRMTGFGPRPDSDRMLRAIDILLHLIARADGADRCAPLCMVAWLNWGLGRASHAAKYIDEVRMIDPGYGMGEVLAGVFTVYPLPEWAFEAPASVGG